MIPDDLLEKLRCPLSPNDVRLERVEGGLVCQRCRLLFPVKNGFVSLRVAAAALPAGCARIEDLPCQQKPPEGRS